MPPKRARRTSPSNTGLAAGEKLKRAKLTGNAHYSAWGWVGTEVSDASAIQEEHRMNTCGFSRRNASHICRNKYAEPRESPPKDRREPVSKGHPTEEAADDVIIISDDEGPSCSLRGCKANPYCLNHLGQDKWEDADDALEAFLKREKLGDNPVLDSRDPGHPVGLKNLGATCYANAFLQVWFQDLPFRRGVYQCQPSPDSEHSFEESPIFQLQVTFAAMQRSDLSAFNPAKLVESLKLRATEQQDAQEFSKLFMAHLDTEFKKQSDPSLKTLISSQFQGKQAYNTVCQKCHRRSERESDFLEIEVNLENNATLEDRLNAWLEPETLSGDNQYLCQACDSLQDAERYTEIRELPPVLHFSLLRFVYDLASMERRKSKQTISFPQLIDMDRFLGQPDVRKRNKKKPVKTSGNLYELRGVLLHKGASAYHGHYEAQVFDVQTNSWYQFNDETVTKLDTLTGVKTAKKPAAYRPPKKKRRIDDSDSEIEIVDGPGTSKQNGAAVPVEAGPSYISSKDAYMLVYSRVGSNGCTGKPQKENSDKAKSPETELTPPSKALEVVDALNDEHDKACQVFTDKESVTRRRFDEMRQKVMDIYRHWALSSRDEDGVVVSRQYLEYWLSRHLKKPNGKKSSPKPDQESAEADAGSNGVAPGSTISLSMDAISCEHGKLDPEKASEMKVIKEDAYRRIIEEEECPIPLRFTVDDVCPICVERSFKERLYQIEHPRMVAQFDTVSPLADDDDGYWISKHWLKDWRLAKPKMHVEGAHDPPPDADEFASDVTCIHDALATNPASRRRISIKSYQLLHHLYPNWRPPSTRVELCAVCEADLHMSKEDKREHRKQAEEEKAKLKYMHDNALNGNTALLEDVPCAIIPAQFVRAWRQWLARPADAARPEGLDNSQFLCEHGQLTLDPNSRADLDTSVAIIKRSDWDVLAELYSAAPLIAVENAGGKMIHDLPVCTDCRIKRRSDFEMAEITIRILGPSDPIPTVENYQEPELPPTPSKPVQTTLLTYSKKQNEGSRKSKRIRQGKEHGKRRKITITKALTVKELKVMIYDQFSIPVMTQRLFYRGKELEDASATMLSLGILANDLLDLREESEDITLLSDSDDEPGTKKPRQEGQGFGGTLLGGGGGGGGNRASSSRPATAPPSSQASIPPDSDFEPGPPGLACPACTYENGAADASCAMCDTPLHYTT